MRASLTNWAFALAVGVALSSGCKSIKPWGEDPSILTGPRAETAGPTTTRAPAITPVTQAGFEATPGLDKETGGSSIVNIPAEDEKPTLWERTVDRMSPKKVTSNLKKAVGLGPNERFAQQQYDEADALFRQANYKEAAKRFKTAAGRWPDSVLEEDALFMLGECYFFSDRYGKASDTYANLLKKYENSRHLDKAVNRHFAIARYWESVGKGKFKLAPNFTDKTRPIFDTTGNAIAVYQSVRLNDPSGPLADDATMATATAYYLQGRWEDAGYHYDLVRKEYPQSEHQPQAHLLGLSSKLQAYQGPQYEAAPLNDAQTLVDQALTQFPTELASERERLLQTRREIRFERAQREFVAGEYYHKTKYYRAARYYYAIVLAEFPDTPFAERAQARMDETKDLPPQPPDHFRWFTGLFPESKKLEQ